MIGLGKWVGSVSTMFFSGDVSFSIAEENGAYAFNMDLPLDLKEAPQYSVKEIKEDGNTLTAKAEISLLPGKTIDLSMTFEGDTMNGQLKIPFLGKIALKDFKKA